MPILRRRILCKTKKKDTFVTENRLLFPNFFVICTRFQNEDVNVSPKRRDARVVEEARLESVYTPKVYRGFESRSLRIAVKGQKVENN